MEMGNVLTRGTSVPELSYDIYHWIIQAVADASIDGARDQICVKTLLSCCLVNRSWRQIAQPILNQTIIVNTDADLNRRILDRTKDDHLNSLRNLVFRENNIGYWTFDVAAILKVLPNVQLLRSLNCYDHARLPESSDAKDRELVGSSRFEPSPLDLDLSGLRQAVLGSIPFGPNWVPLLRSTPNLQYLIFHGCGWWGHSSYARSSLYLPIAPPPFRLKRLEIFRSHIKEAPLRWLLSGGSPETLTYLEVSYPQSEWDTFRIISNLRAEGLLPNVSHLTYSLSDSRGAQKYYKENTSTPLSMWNGLKTVNIYARDSKGRGAIFHGISQLSPPPRIEMGVGDMRMVEFKALFRLRKGKLQPGTQLRLVTRRPDDAGGPRGGYVVWDGGAEDYWIEMEEDAVEVAGKHGVEVEVAAMPLYEVMRA